MQGTRQLHWSLFFPKEEHVQTAPLQVAAEPSANKHSSCFIPEFRHLLEAD